MNDEIQLDRVPPNQLEAEQAVLSAVILDNDALVTVMEMLDPEDFYLGSHQELFKCMQEMFEAGKPVDLVTLADHLQASGKLETIGGFTAISDLSGRVSTAANISYWANIVKNKSLLRKFITETTSLITEAYQEPEEVEEFLDRASGKVMEVSSDQTTQTVRPINEVVSESFKIIEDLDDRQGEITGVPTGFEELDKMTSGFQKSDLIILAARPSMGKTALGLNFMTHAALSADKKVIFFSLEMAANQLVMRMLCSEAMLASNRIRQGNIPQSYWGKLTTAADKLSRSKIFIEDSAGLSILELKAKTRRIHAEQDGLDMVVVDYLQLLRGSGSKRNKDSREQEIAEISRSLKGMAKELKIPVLALSQLNRGPESREGGEPRLSDLRESGSIEQDADIVMMIHRPGKYAKTEDGEPAEDNITKLKIEKQRNGPTGVIDLVFLKEFTKFETFEGRYDDAYSPEG